MKSAEYLLKQPTKFHTGSSARITDFGIEIALANLVVPIWLLEYQIVSVQIGYKLEPLETNEEWPLASEMSGGRLIYLEAWSINT